MLLCHLFRSQGLSWGPWTQFSEQTAVKRTLFPSLLALGHLSNIPVCLQLKAALSPTGAYPLATQGPCQLTLQVGHRDVGVDAIDGPTGLKGAVPTWFVVPFTLIWGVVVITEYS